MPDLIRKIRKVSVAQYAKEANIEVIELTGVAGNLNVVERDSPQMRAVKDSLRACKDKWNDLESQDEVEIDRWMNELEQLYLKALRACQIYCDKKNPHGKPNQDRKIAVEDAKERLRQEYRKFSLFREKLYSKTENQEKNRQVVNFHTLATENQKEIEKKRKEKEIAEREKGKINKLTFDDFTEILWDRAKTYGYKKKDRFHLYMEPNSESERRANRRLAEQLVTVSIDRLDQAEKLYGEGLNLEQKVRLKKSLFKMLEMKEHEDLCGPLSMENIQRVMDYVNTAASDVDRILKKDADPDGIDVYLANQVNVMLPGSFLADQTSKNRETYVKNQKTRLKTILADAKRRGIDNSDISGHALEDVINGKLFLIRDDVYRHLRYMYRCANLFGDRSMSPQEFFAPTPENRKFLTDLFAYAIKKAAAKTPLYKTLAENQMIRYAEDHAFQTMGRTELLEAMRMGYNAQLAEGGEGLRESIARRISKVRAWKHKEKQVVDGTQKLERLCNLLRRERKLQERIFADNGLKDEQMEELKVCCQEIDRLMRNDRENMELVASGLENTRFKTGFRKLRKNLDTNGFSYENLAEKLTERMRRLQEKKEDKEKKDKEEQQRKKEKREQNAQENENKPEETYGFELVDIDYRKYCLNRFSGNSRRLGQMLLLEIAPSKLIKNEKDADSIETLHDVLLTISSGAVNAARIKLDGLETVFHVNETGNLICRMEGKELNLSVPVDVLIRGIEEDVCKNLSKYGTERANRMLRTGLERTESGEGEAKNQVNRAMMYNLLKHQTGLTVDELSNESSKNLAVLCLHLLKDGKPMGKDAAWSILNQGKDQMEPEVNDREILEYVKELEKQVKDGTFRNAVNYGEKKLSEKTEDRITWTEDEAAVKKMLADLICPEETWDQDLMQSKDRIDRLRHTLYQHAKTLAKLIKNPGLVSGLTDKMGTEFDFDIAGELNNVMENLLKNMDEGAEKILKSGSEEELTMMVRILVGSNEDVTREDVLTLQRSGLGATLMAAFKLQELKNQNKGLLEGFFAVLGDITEQKKEDKVLDSLNQIREKIKLSDKLKELDEQIGENIAKQQVLFQKKMDRYIGQIFTAEPQADKKQEELTLAQMLENNMSGGSGQGLFYKKVLQGYFANATEHEKRDMLASAIRDLKPDQLYDNPELLDEEKKQYKNLQAASFFSGFFKGSGPLMQKVLQGLPTDQAAPEFKQALDDVKSNLHSISPTLVSTRFNRLIEDSNGAITKIDIEGSLGAASVGEAFLCKIYGPSIGKDGREIVIKMLRPDARKRMKKDAKFFAECAKETDAGMEKTFAGQLKVYEDELDFNIEAENIDLGQIYNKDDPSVQSEQKVKLVGQTPDLLLLEKAPGTTVGKYFKEVTKKKKELEARIDRLAKYEGPGEIVPQTVELYKDLINHQKMLTLLAKKWVREGIFESGFYQGDLHKDNIMMDKDQATVIDFGNSTILTEDQQKEIMHVIFSAYTRNAAGFAVHFENLLSPEFKDSYLHNKDQMSKFRSMLDTVLNKRGDAGTKIAVALAEAQKLGMEIPSAINNFSLGQIRLQNTIEECNTLIKNFTPLIDKLGTKIGKTMYNINGMCYPIQSELLSYAWINRPEKGKKRSSANIRELKNIARRKLGLIPSDVPDDRKANEEFALSIIADLKSENAAGALSAVKADLKEIFRFQGPYEEQKADPVDEFYGAIRHDLIEVRRIPVKELKNEDVIAHPAYKKFREKLVNALIVELEEREKPLLELKNMYVGKPTNFFDVMNQVIGSYKGKTTDMLGFHDTWAYSKRANEVHAQEMEEEEREKEREEQKKEADEAEEARLGKAKNAFIMINRYLTDNTVVQYLLDDSIRDAVNKSKNPAGQLITYGNGVASAIESVLPGYLKQDEQEKIKKTVSWFRDDEAKGRLAKNQDEISRLTAMMQNFADMQVEIGRSEAGKKVMEKESGTEETWKQSLYNLQRRIESLRLSYHDKIQAEIKPDEPENRPLLPADRVDANVKPENDAGNQEKDAPEKRMQEKPKQEEKKEEVKVKHTEKLDFNRLTDKKQDLREILVSRKPEGNKGKEEAPQKK